MFTGIDGYAALLLQDESRALELKKLFHELFHSHVGKYEAKIHRRIGHESLSLFSSAAEAVECAIELQLAFREDGRLPVKIGVHLGDVVLTEEDVIGEGIDVARRIKSVALPGSILISHKIHQEVKNHTGVQSAFFRNCEVAEGGEQVEVHALVNEGLVVPENQNNRQARGYVDTRSGLRRFWEEAKRRNVVRVVSYYAAGAYVALEASDILSDNLHLPSWVMPAIIVLLVALFIVLTIVSWIYDITPEGIKKTDKYDPLAEALKKQSPDTEGSPAGDVVKASWFRKHRVLRRYLVPAAVLGLVLVFYLSKDRIFQNWERVNKVAKEHTDIAMLFVRNDAQPSLVKRELDLALAADPDYSPALHTYALVHLVEGDSALAKQKLQRIVESDAKFSQAWALLANFAFWEDSMELALHYTTRAVETDPGNSLAAYAMALQCEDRGLYQEAEVWYLRALEMDSTFASAYSALGAFYNKRARPVDAGIILRKSLSISPASPDNYRVYKNLAESHFLLQQYVQAFEYLDKSKALNPDYPDTERCYALYYEARGYLQESVLHWRKYLALEEDSTEMHKAQKHLDSLRFMVQP